MYALLKATLIAVAIFPQLINAQDYFTAGDYKRALWMTTRFYGAQRSGNGPNWLIMQHDSIRYRTSFTNDADGSCNIEGGWFDCGDHVTFGQTFFYSAYILAKAYDLFPLGFHDLYNGFDYADYVSSGNWDLEGGSPDGIPDLLQELKYATDWIIKAAPDGSTFYYQKGEGAKDHTTWVTSGKMSSQPVENGGEPRKVFKNPDDGMMPSFAAATLAIMSRVYKKYDTLYAKTCFDHAKYAYTYAKSHKGSSAGAGCGCCYGSSKSAYVAFITGASEMFAASGDETYKSDALAEQDKIEFHNYGLDYSNTHDLAPLAMATSGIDTTRFDQLKTLFLDQYTASMNSEGICTRGNSGWGALRYPANHAFIAAAWSEAKKDTTLHSFIFKQIDFIMGKNSAMRSFIVGFCSGCEKETRYPHHRNVYLRDDNPNDSAKEYMTIPERNQRFGYLVGGTWNSSDYTESVTNYSMTEGGIDYNAGLVGALGYIVSRLDPADTAGMVPVYRSSRQKKGVIRPEMLTIRQSGSDIVLLAANGGRIVEAEFFDCRGRLVARIPGGAAQLEMDRKSLGPGVYAIRGNTEDGRTLYGALYLINQ